MKVFKLLSALSLAFVLTGCIAPAIGTAVDTTVEVIEAPFAIAGTIVAAPFRAVGSAVDAKAAAAAAKTPN